MKNSHIEWTDHTFNPWEGCTKVSPGCANCYAETRNKRWSGGANWGPGAPRRRTSEANWKQPLKWNREATEGPLPGDDPLRRPRVFCASLADWLDDEVPIEWLGDLLELIRCTPNLDWLLLTKRPENWEHRMRALVNSEKGSPLAYQWRCAHEAPANVWLGTTVEDQQRADERIPKLIEIPARVRFLSCEPLLGPVDLHQPPGGAFRFSHARPGSAADQGIDWVIVGGESGSKARPMHPDWARSLRGQCEDEGVAFFFKQWGEWLPGEQTPTSGTCYRRCDNGAIYATSGDPERQNFGTHPDRYSGRLITMKIGKLKAGRLLDGKEHSEFPTT